MGLLEAVYLHFASRSGLLVALVEHMDHVLALGEMVQPVHHAPTGRVALERMVGIHAAYHAHIIGVTRVLTRALLTRP